MPSFRVVPLPVGTPEVSGTVIHRYSPRREFLLHGLITAVSAALALLLPGGLWPLSVLFGLTALHSFIRLLKCSRVTIAEGTGGIVLTERTFIGGYTRHIPLEEICGTRIRRKGVLFRRRSARLLLQAAGLEYDLGRFPTESARVFQTWMHHLRLYRDMPVEDEPEPCERPGEQAALKTVRKMVWAMLEMSIKCPGCQMPVPVNGLLEEITCTECGTETSLTIEHWRLFLKGVRREVAYELAPGTGSESMIMAEHHVSLLYARMKPYCPMCKEDFPEPYSAGQDMKCSCGGTLSVRTAPRWLQKPFKGAGLVAEPRSFPEAERRQVTVTCSSCGTPFGVTGLERCPGCPGCGTGFFLDNDLWHHFHPAPVVKRWFIGFMAGFKGEPSEE
jgi:hypothetical protein